MARYRLSAGSDYRKTENSFKQEQFASLDEIACLLNIIYRGCYLLAEGSKHGDRHV